MTYLHFQDRLEVAPGAPLGHLSKRPVSCRSRIDLLLDVMRSRIVHIARWVDLVAEGRVPKRFDVN